MSAAPLWIDADMGFDDIVAIEMAVATGAPILGIGLVAGNGPLPSVIANGLAAAGFFGWAAPLHAGADAPLACDLVTAESVLGQGGLSTVGRALPPGRRSLDPSDAVMAMAAALERSPAPIRLVPLGPLTNIARLLTARPDLKPGIAEIALMGGSAGRGNHSAAAEFNFACDPEAAEIIFGAGLPIRMFGLDVGRICTVSRADAEALRALGGERAETVADHLEAYLRIRSPDGSAPMPFYDPTVAAWLLDPDCIGFEPARVEIETIGRHTRGMSVCEFRVPKRGVPNALVAMSADAARFRALLHAALAKGIGHAP